MNAGRRLGREHPHRRELVDGALVDQEAAVSLDRRQRRRRAAAVPARRGDRRVQPGVDGDGGEGPDAGAVDAVVVRDQRPHDASSRSMRTRSASRSIWSRPPLPSPRRVTLRAPAALPSRRASASVPPRASPAATAAVSESPAPRVSTGSSAGAVAWTTCAVDHRAGPLVAVRDDHVAGAVVDEPGHRRLDRAGRGEQAVTLELLLADLQHVDAAGDDRPQPFAREVGDDPPTVGPDVDGEAAVGVGGQHVGPVLGTGQHRDLGAQCFDERGAVEVVDVVAAERVGRHRRHLDARAAAAIVDVGPVAPGVDADDRQAHVDHQPAQDRPGLAPERGADHHVDVEAGQQPGDPEALAARVEVHLAVATIGARPLDRDRQQRRRGEDADTGLAAHGTTRVPLTCGVLTDREDRPVQEERRAPPEEPRGVDRMLGWAEDGVYLGIAVLLVVSSAVLLVVAVDQTLDVIGNLLVGSRSSRCSTPCCWSSSSSSCCRPCARRWPSASCSPSRFLIVGIIASIKEIVVLSVKAAEAIGKGAAFSDQLWQIGVLAGVVVLLGTTAYLLRRKEREPDEGAHRA